jgi:hypothetical protein
LTLNGLLQFVDLLLHHTPLIREPLELGRVLGQTIAVAQRRLPFGLVLVEGDPGQSRRFEGLWRPALAECPQLV